jgi:hypothetical protein
LNAPQYGTKTDIKRAAPLVTLRDGAYSFNSKRQQAKYQEPSAANCSAPNRNQNTVLNSGMNWKCDAQKQNG